MDLVKKVVLFAVMLGLCVILCAQQQPPSLQEQQLVQRLYETQMTDSDSDFYDAHAAYMSYLKERKEWEKYYRAWMNRVIYDVNHKYFHRAFSEVELLNDDIKNRHQEQYLYISNMCLGFL